VVEGHKEKEEPRSTKYGVTGAKKKKTCTGELPSGGILGKAESVGAEGKLKWQKPKSAGESQKERKLNQ